MRNRQSICRRNRKTVLEERTTTRRQHSFRGPKLTCAGRQPMSRNQILYVIRQIPLPAPARQDCVRQTLAPLEEMVNSRFDEPSSRQSCKNLLQASEHSSGPDLLSRKGYESSKRIPSMRPLKSVKGTNSQMEQNSIPSRNLLSRGQLGGENRSSERQVVKDNEDSSKLDSLANSRQDLSAKSSVVNKSKIFWVNSIRRIEDEMKKRNITRKVTRTSATLVRPAATLTLLSEDASEKPPSAPREPPCQAPLLEREEAVQVSEQFNERRLEVEETFTQRAELLDLLCLSKTQYPLSQVYPLKLKQICWKFYDQQFQPLRREAEQRYQVQFVSDFKFAGSRFLNPALFRKKLSCVQALHRNFDKFAATLNLVNTFDKNCAKRLFESPSGLSALGLYSIWLCLGGEFRPVLIDDLLPVENDSPALLNSAGGQSYPLLLMKAMAKGLGGYSRLQSKEPADLIHMMTGAPAFHRSLKTASSRQLPVMEWLLQSKAIIVLKRNGLREPLSGVPVRSQESREQASESESQPLFTSEKYMQLLEMRVVSARHRESRCLVRTQDGQLFLLAENELLRRFEQYSGCLYREDYYYSYQRISLPANRICAVNFKSKRNNVVISLLQLKELHSVKLSLYRFKSSDNRQLLEKVSTSCSKQARFTFTEQELEGGSYLLFVEISDVNVLQNLCKSAYNTKLQFGSLRTPAELKRELTVSFYSKKVLRLGHIEELLDEGNGVGNLRKCFVPVEELDEAELGKSKEVTIDKYILWTNHKHLRSDSAKDEVDEGKQTTSKLSSSKAEGREEEEKSQRAEDSLRASRSRPQCRKLQFAEGDQSDEQ